MALDGTNFVSRVRRFKVQYRTVKFGVLPSFRVLPTDFERRLFTKADINVKADIWLVLPKHTIVLLPFFPPLLHFVP